MYGHLKSAASWFGRRDNYGEHGLPRIHHADWNDALNIPDEKAESVFMAMLICKVYDDLAELSSYIGDKEYAAELKKLKKRLADKVNDAAYNGEYYVRAFSKFGTVGDKTKRERRENLRQSAKLVDPFRRMSARENGKRTSGDRRYGNGRGHTSVRAELREL